MRERMTGGRVVLWITASLMLTLLFAAALAQDAERRKGFSVTITDPEMQGIVLGKSRLAAEVEIPTLNDVDRVEFYVSDELVFIDREPPFECFHDFGEESKSYVVRAVAHHVEGISVSDAVVTRRINVGYSERVNRVILWATVTDGKDNLITGLDKDDFEVREDGTPQDILDFYPEDRPITLAILLDTSGSMHDNMRAVHEAAGSFVETLRPEDRALVIDFDDKVFLIQDLTADHDNLKEAITSTQPMGSTSIYDALHATFKRIGQLEGRKAIVLLSDGDDTSSQFGYDRVLEEAKANNIIIYGIGLGGGDRKVLKDFPRITGGRAFFVNKASELASAYERIAMELRRQYYITYSTTNDVWDGRWVQVRVKTLGENYNVRARRGFFAVKTGDGALGG